MVDFRPALTGTLEAAVEGDGINLGVRQQVSGEFVSTLERTAPVPLAGSVPYTQLFDQTFTPQLVKEGVGLGVEEIDTDAIDLMWAYATNGAYNRYPAASGDLTRNVTKGPMIRFPSGKYSYGGVGLSFEPGMSTIIYMAGDGHSSTRISLPGGVYLIDSTNNPVFLAMTGLHIEGGKGAVRWKSTAVNANRGVIFRDNLVSNYTECGYSSNSQDFPYQKISDNCFVSADGAEAIGVAIAGLTAGSYINSNIFQRNRYHIKLAPVSISGDDKGPATPIVIKGNDFIRIATPSTNTFDIWMVPNADTSQNAGRAITLTDNKFGNESLTTGDARILVADEGAGTFSGDKQHVATKSSGYINGILSRNNNYNFLQTSTVPLIRSYTGRLYNFRMDDIIDNSAPSYVCEYAGGVAASDLDKQSGTNQFSYAHNLSAASGNIAPPLTNLAGTWAGFDPLGWSGRSDVGVAAVTNGSGRSINILTASSAAAFTTSSASITPINDSAGGVNLGASVTVSGASGNVSSTLVFASIVEGDMANLEFELWQGSSNSLGSVRAEVRDNTGALILQRVYELQPNWRWFRLPVSFLKSGRTSISVRFIANDYSAGAKEQFRLGRVYAYHGSRP